MARVVNMGHIDSNDFSWSFARVMPYHVVAFHDCLRVPPHLQGWLYSETLAMKKSHATKCVQVGEQRTPTFSTSCFKSQSSLDSMVDSINGYKFRIIHR